MQLKLKYISGTIYIMSWNMLTKGEVDVDGGAILWPQHADHVFLSPL